MAWTGRTAIGQPGTRLAPIPYHPCNNGEPRAPWVRGRPARIRAILRVPGARASRPHTRNPERPWVRGRPRPHTRNPERPWVRGRLARIRAILRMPGARASRPHARNPARAGSAGVSPACTRSWRDVGSAGVSPACTRSWRDVGCAGVSPACAQSCACRERGRPARMRRLRAEALAEHVEAPAGLRRRASLGARASRTEKQEPRTENHVHPGCAGVPNREPRTTCPLGARASRTENQEPRTENHVHPGCAGVSPACGDCGLMEIEHLIRYALLLWG